jgi:transcription-repair coupling factor (superfamily II helicase)
MRKTITLILFAFFATLVTSCGPTKEEAIDYNDKIITEQVAIIEKIDKLYDAMKNYTDHQGLDSAYAAALKQIETSSDILSKLEKFDDDTEFRDAALKLFATYRSVLQNEMKKMIDFSKLPDELYTTEVEDEFTKLSDITLTRMDDDLKQLNAAQVKFANKHKFEIEKKPNPK